MSTYKAPLADIRFALHDVLQCEALFDRLGFEDATRDIVDAVLEEGARFSETVLAPLNRVGDEAGCVYDKADASVTTPPGFSRAYAQYVEGGWAGLASPVEFGGQGMPHTIGVPIKEMIDAANLSWGNFPLLSHGATEALLLHGDAWQQDVFLRRLVSGEWTGTMCLTEAHCGTDLGMLRTKAVPSEDGSDQRDQDLHHRRRARLHRQHRASGAGAVAGRARGQQGHQHVHRAQDARPPTGSG